MSYSAYNAILSVSKMATDPAGHYKDSLQHIVDTRFEFASDYTKINYLNRTTLVPTEIGVRLTKPNSMNGSAELKDDFFKVILKNFCTQITLGDLFEFDNYRWMVVDLSSVQSDIQSCMIQRCNVKLKFVESNNDVLPTISDTIISIDAIAEKKIYSPETDKYYTTPLEDINVKVANNANSRKILFDKNNGTRFLIGNPALAYDVKGIDSVSLVRTNLTSSNTENGILLLKLSMGRLNAREDNVSLLVAKQRCYGGV